MKRDIESLTSKDFAEFPIWRFTNSDRPRETYVTPVRRLPAKNLSGCIVGCPLRLANGAVVPGNLGNLDPANVRLTEQFLTVSVFRSDGAIFHLARYHDFDATERGPAALAAFLGLSLKAVFPITYDVSAIVTGLPEVVRGTIPAEPHVRLTRAEIIALAVP
ncbi:MAG: hypothetical protein JNK93_15025 [Planctomycetia bacterium]|nr:hypothetical protein [Planctomycetia bacterium]